jgi:hypothetical protein
MPAGPSPLTLCSQGSFSVLLSINNHFDGSPLGRTLPARVCAQTRQTVGLFEWRPLLELDGSEAACQLVNCVELWRQICDWAVLADVWSIPMDHLWYWSGGASIYVADDLTVRAIVIHRRGNPSIPLR